MTATLKKLIALVVDDNEYTLRLMRAMLRAAGVENIRVASNPETALKDLGRLCPDVIFVDWSMEPFDGCTFVRRVRGSADLRLRSVPILMVTGHAENERISEAMAAGVTDYLVKPVSPKVVETRLLAALRNSRPPTEATQSKPAEA